MNLNKAMLIGRVTKDPELRALTNGGTVASFGLATNRVYKDKNDQKQELTEFHNIVVFGRLAETVVSQYVKKGQLLYVEGRIQTRSWDDKDTGAKKYRTEIVVENLQLGPRAGDGGGRPYKSKEEEDADRQWDEMSGAVDAAKEEETPGEKVQRAVKTTAKKHTGAAYPEEDINPEDIPF